MDVSFRIGDKAVYPAHGVARSPGSKPKKSAATSISFYILRILENGMRIMVPTKNVAAVGLRSVCNKNEVKEVYDILKTREVSVDGQTWNRRYREYMEKIKTGSVFEIAEVLRDLSLLKLDKDLSLRRAQDARHGASLLVRELAVAKSAKEEKIVAELEKIFTC